MKNLTRLFAVALGCVVLVVGFVMAFATWWGGSSSLNIREVGQTLALEVQRRDALEQRDEAVLRCTRGKLKVTKALIAGQISLPDAVDQFRELQSAIPESDPRFVGNFRGPRNDEELYRNVLVWVENVMDREGAQRTDLLARLQGEMQTQLQRTSSL